GACLIIMTPDSSTDARVMDDTREAHQLGKVVIPVLMAGDVFPAYAATPYIDMRGTPDEPPAVFWNRLKETIGERAGRGAFMTDDEKVDDDSSMVTHITKPARLRDLAQALRASTTPPPMAESPNPPTVGQATPDTPAT